MESYIGWILLVPPIAVLLMPWASRAGKWAANTLAIAATGLLLFFTLRLIPAIGTGLKFEYYGARFALDSVSLLFLVVVNAVAFACMIYATSYIGHLGGRGKFFALLLIMVSGLNAMLLTRDLFSLYVFLEVASIASYVLVAFGLEYDGIESAIKYLLLSAVATSMILLGIALIYMNTGTLEFDALKAILAAQGGDLPAIFLLTAALFIGGFGLKAALMPFHAWLPDAHPSAPAPISAMLSGVVIKVAGVYALARIFFYIFPGISRVHSVFLILGTLSMIAGAVLAYFQRDFKRMLAYSSISQIGYIMIGLGLGNLLGLIGALFHVFNHALFKSLLFLNSGAVQYRLRHARHRGNGRTGKPDAGYQHYERIRHAFDRRRSALQRILQQAVHHPRRAGGGKDHHRRAGDPGEHFYPRVLPDHSAQSVLRKAQRKVAGHPRSSLCHVVRRNSPGCRLSFERDLLPLRDQRHRGTGGLDPTGRQIRCCFGCFWD